MVGIFGYEHWESNPAANALVFRLPTRTLTSAPSEALAEAISELLHDQGFDDVEPYVLPAGLTTKQTYDRIVIPTQTEAQQLEVRRVLENTGEVPPFEIYLIVYTSAPYASSAPSRITPGPTERMLKTPSGGELLVESTVLLDQSGVLFAYPEFENSSWTVQVHLTRRGAKKFTQVIGNKIGRQIAFAVDGVVLSTPFVYEQTFGGVVSMTGMSEPDAKKLALQLSQDTLLNSLEDP